MENLKLTAVVLAAGKSQRMGTNKLLLKIAGRTILDRLLEVLEASVNEVIIVLGHRPEELKPVIEAHRAKAIFNPDFERGMTSSVKAGLRHASGDAAFVVLGDQLGLDAELLNSMAEAMLSDPRVLIVSPVYQGRRGHPILIRRSLFQKILNLGEGETLKDIVARYDDVHKFVEGSVWSIMDIDTPEDFERAKRLWRSMSY